LIENYETKTTDELMELIPNKTRKAINRKVEELRAEGTIGYRDSRTVKRAYRQRGKSGRPTKDNGGGLSSPLDYEEV